MSTYGRRYWKRVAQTYSSPGCRRVSFYVIFNTKYVDEVVPFVLGANRPWTHFTSRRWGSSFPKENTQDANFVNVIERMEL
jgi:hypothetical protein